MPSGICQHKLVYGVGVNDCPGEAKVDGRHTGFYAAWASMLKRCYSGRYPTYKGCSVCTEWLTLSNFREWHNVNYHEGWALDKDILIPGNKVYRPEACRCVPGYINSVLLDSGAVRGDLPVGVMHADSSINPYRAQCKDGHGHLLYDTHRPTIADAKADYVRLKTEVVREQVLRAFDEGLLSDVCCALLERDWGAEKLGSIYGIASTKPTGHTK